MESRKNIKNIVTAALILVMVFACIMVVGSLKGWFGPVKGDAGIECVSLKGIGSVTRKGVSYSLKEGHKAVFGDRIATGRASEAELAGEGDFRLFLSEKTEISLSPGGDSGGISLDIIKGEARILTGDDERVLKAGERYSSDTGEPPEMAEESAETEETGKQVPAEKGKKLCIIGIECKDILGNMENLSRGKDRFVPEDGVILHELKMEFEAGESVYDVTRRACLYKDIQMEAAYTPVYGSYYVEGINNLYEFDCGEMSGWIYKVNGESPNYGCSEYELEDGDTILWSYTCSGN